ncbi:MAG TPA: aminotransferase class V-fold PLP-dependent enzyme [Caulobacter sp.]|nr:aminotransferase class V-fold PLP-dependent enzyme [Caulobacter sp.]
MANPSLSERAAAQFPDLRRVALNGARWHPLPRVAVEAMAEHARFRAADGGWGEDPGSAAQGGSRAAFARLIGAAAEDIALVPSTTVAEQMVVRALGLPASGAIVTDLMHFDGSICFYDFLADKGADVRVVEPRDGRIDLDDIARALERGGVRLIAVSAISNMTGFCHDLAALTDLAHSHGVLVYADVIQMVGAVPFDVASTGVDFCAASGYKWLMGDMGLGFLYVRPEVVQQLERPLLGFRQIARDIMPWPPLEGTERRWEMVAGPIGLFEGASLPVTAAVSLQASIRLIESIGVNAITEHRAPLIQQLDDGFAARGYPRITPTGSVAPFIVYGTGHDRLVGQRLRAANIHAGVMDDILRVSVSIHTDAEDIERLLAALDA